MDKYTAGMSFDELMETLKTYSYNNRACRYVAVASFAFLIYYHLCTFDEEVAYIWKRQDGGSTLGFGRFRMQWIGWGRILFLTVRYFTAVSFVLHMCSLFIMEPSDTFCFRVVHFQGWATVIIIALCDLILLIRVWAIYGRKPLVLAILLSLMIACLVPMCVIGGLWLKSMYIIPNYLYPVFGGCAAYTESFTEYWKILMFSVGFNSVLSGMTLYKTLGRHKMEIKTPLTTLLVRDGTIYYFIILAALLLSGFGVYNANMQLISLQGRFLNCVLCCVACQIQLNLRGALFDPVYTYEYPNRRSITNGIGLGTLSGSGVTTSAAERKTEISTVLEIGAAKDLGDTLVQEDSLPMQDDIATACYDLGEQVQTEIKIVESRWKQKHKEYVHSRWNKSPFAIATHTGSANRPLTPRFLESEDGVALQQVARDRERISVEDFHPQSISPWRHSSHEENPQTYITVSSVKYDLPPPPSRTSPSSISPPVPKWGFGGIKKSEGKHSWALAMPRAPHIGATTTITTNYQYQEDLVDDDPVLTRPSTRGSEEDSPNTVEHIGHPARSEY